MNRKILYAAWAALFVLCAAFGFLPERSGSTQALMTALSLLFFIPPAMLLYRADSGTRKRVGLLSALSLGLTVVMLVLNIVFAAGSTAMGNVLHGILTVVSAPMLCCGSWVVSLFLWACLLVSAKPWKIKKE